MFWTFLEELARFSASVFFVTPLEVFPKQQLKHIHAANAVISSQREGFELKSEIEKRKEEETRDVW